MIQTNNFKIDNKECLQVLDYDTDEIFVYFIDLIDEDDDSSEIVNEILKTKGHNPDSCSFILSNELNLKVEVL